MSLQHSSLTFVDRRLVNFGDHSYRWVDIKQFSYQQEDASDADLLDALLHDWRYRDHYSTFDSHERDSETIHGPYFVDRITKSSFLPSSNSELRAVWGEFCALSESPVPITVQSEVERLVLIPAEAAAAIWKLPEQPEAKHDWAWVLSPFHEFIIVDPTPLRLLLVVMAID